MSKAEDRALEKYPKKIELVGNQWDGAPFDVNCESRVAYKQGYRQAEKDMELTWKDINNIKLLTDQVECDYVEIDKKLYTKDFYEEVLKRFKDLKK